MARNSGLMPDDEEEAPAPSGDQMGPNQAEMAPSEAEPEEEAGEQPNVSPEEQQVYDQFVDNAFSLIYDAKTLPGVLKALEGDGNFVDGLAHTTVTIVMRVLESAKQAGQQVSGDVLMAAGQQIMEDLAETAGKAGVHDYAQDEIEAAYLRAMDFARERMTQSGDVDPKALKTEFAALIAADRQGRLEEFVPGVAGRKTEGEEPAEVPEPDDEEEAE